MKIKENGRRERWKVTSLHEEEIEGKQRKNEEIRCINNKKPSEHHFGAFFSLALELASEGEEHQEEKVSKESKGRTKKTNVRQGRATSSIYNEIIGRYRFACVISLLVLACMVHACVYLVLLLSLAWVFPGVTMVSTLPYHFRIAMVWWGCFTWLS